MCAAALLAHVRRGDTVWNVGANVGVYTLQLAHMVGDTGRVVAFEPNPRTIAVLRRNVALNGYEDRVLVEPMAVAERSGHVQLFAAGDSQMARISHPNPLDGPQEPIAVPATSLDDYAVHHGMPAGLVMDIEGLEVAALQGAKRLLADGPDWMLVELHPDAWAWSGNSAAELLHLLNDYGWIATPLSGQNSASASYGHVLLERRPGRDVVNALSE